MIDVHLPEWDDIDGVLLTFLRHIVGVTVASSKSLKYTIRTTH